MGTGQAGRSRLCWFFYMQRFFTLSPEYRWQTWPATENCNSYPNIIQALSCSTNFCLSRQNHSYLLFPLRHYHTFGPEGKSTCFAPCIWGKMNGICLISNRWILHQFNEKAWSRAKMHPDDSSWVFGRKAFIKCIILIILIPLLSTIFPIWI